MLFLAYRSAVERYGRPSQRSESTGIRRELFRFGIHSSVTTSVGSATDSLLPVLVGSMQGASAAAIFAIAKLPLTVASLVTVPVRIVFLPEQARLSAQENPAAVRRSVAAYVKTASVIAAVGVVAGWVLLPTLINLFYGESFEGAVPPARILLVAAAIFVAFGWTKILPVAIGRPELRTRTLGAVSALILIGTFGLGGSAVAAATAVSVAYVIYAMMWVWLFKRLLPKAEERV
jgi:O-antigen/teichoic acid export membrane protein